MRRQLWWAIALGAALLAAGLAGGCSSDSERDPAVLEGKSWVAVEIDGIGEVGGADGVESTAQFAGTSVGGAGGVNSYSGVVVASSDGKMAITELVSTLMAGPEPAMSQETAFMDALAETANFEVTETELVLMDGSGKQLVRFEAAE